MRRSSVGIWIVGLMLVLASCTPAAIGDGSAPDPSGRQAETVAVTTGTIVSVVTVDGELMARPRGRVLAARDGQHFESSVAEGDVAAAGEVLATYHSDDQLVEVTVPFEVTVVSVEAPDTSSVVAGVPLLMVEASGFGITAAIPAESLFRFPEVLPSQARMQITAGPGPADCALLSGVADTSRQPGLTVVCVPDVTVGSIEGLPGVLAVPVGTRKDVLVLPMRAVAGASNRGLVLKRQPDGTFTEVEVGLGLSDGVTIEITAGLAEGDVVRALAPDLRPLQTKR